MNNGPSPDDLDSALDAAMSADPFASDTGSGDFDDLDGDPFAELSELDEFPEFDELEGDDGAEGFRELLRLLERNPGLRITLSYD